MALIDRVGVVCRQASSTVEGRVAGRRRARQADGRCGQRQPPALLVDGSRGDGTWEHGGASADGVGPLEEIGEGSGGDGTTAIVLHVGGRGRRGLLVVAGGGVCGVV